MNKPKCLMCHKELETDGNNIIYDGGCATISFGYGSRHDQIGYSNLPEEALDKMLACHEIRLYVCDDCFENNLSLFEGYKVTMRRKETRVM